MANMPDQWSKQGSVPGATHAPTYSEPKRLQRQELDRAGEPLDIRGWLKYIAVAVVVVVLIILLMQPYMQAGREKHLADVNRAAAAEQATVPFNTNP